MSSVHVAVHGLSKHYGSHQALRDCSLEIGRGEVFGLLGPNGAGKTTLIRLLMGYLEPTAGEARIQGLHCHRDRVAVHRQCGYLPGDARLFRSMNGRQVLRFFSAMHPSGNFQRALQMAERLELNLRRWVAFMSTGMRQKLALAAVLALDVPLVILDEPTANLDPNMRQTVLDVIRERKASGATVLFSSHVLSEVEDVCDRVAILRAGQLVHQQTLADLRGHYRIEAVCDGAALDEIRPLTEVISYDPATGAIALAASGDLRPVLGWLARHARAGVEVHRAGLRDIYRQWHGPRGELT